MRPSSPLCVRLRELLHARKVNLVLNRTVAQPAPIYSVQKRIRLLDGRRHRLFGIDVLVCGDSFFDDADAPLRRRGIKEDRIVGIGERSVEVGRPVGDAVRACDRRKALGVAPRKQKTRDDAIVAYRQTAFIADGDQGVGEMLGRGDTAGRAVDDDPDGLVRHSWVRHSKRGVPMALTAARGRQTMLCH